MIEYLAAHWLEIVGVAVFAFGVGWALASYENGTPLWPW